MRTFSVLFGFIFIVTSAYTTYSYANTTPDLSALYESWKNDFTTHEGASGYLRVLQNKDRETTVSEGQGYGMLLAAYNNDTEAFDKLWGYTKLYLNERGLMHWQIDRYGSVTGRNGATDGDEDIAFALLVAYRLWGKYEDEARTYIDAIYTYEVEKETYVLKPGDVWGGSHITNPSYCAPAYYRMFAEFTHEDGWLRVLDTCYAVIGKSRNTKTGLVPEWTTAEGGIAYDLTHNKNRDNFSYNAIRVPWRTALDWVWNEEPRAYTINDHMTDFFDKQKKLYSGYTLSGKPTVSYFDATFAAGIAVGSLASNNVMFRDEMIKRLIEMTSNNYYGATLRLLSLMLIMDKFPNFAAAPTPNPEQEKNGTTAPDTLHSPDQQTQESEDPEEETVPDTQDMPKVDEVSSEEIESASSTPSINLPNEIPAIPEEDSPSESDEENYTITIESPDNGTILSGEKKIKAFVEELPLEEYTMTFSADGVVTGVMSDAAGSFKQAKIQFDEWTWNEAGPYIVTLHVYDTNGQEIGSTDLTLYIKH